MNFVWRCEPRKNQFCRLKAQPAHYQEYAIIASESEVEKPHGKKPLTIRKEKEKDTLISAEYTDTKILAFSKSFLLSSEIFVVTLLLQRKK